GPRGAKRECPNKEDRLSKSCDECHSRAGLLKAGAEKICKLFRLRPRFRQDAESYQMLGSPAGTICLVCELEDEHGMIVAEGRGARTKDQEYGEVNKTIKLAEKAAQTDAVLRFAAVSEIFSQDTDEVKEGEKRRKKAEKEAKAA